MKRRNLLIVSFLIFLSFTVQVQTKTLKVACVGNSITQGAGIKDKVRDSYPAVLGRMLGNGYEVQNFGRSGATLLRNGNYPYWKVPEYQNAKNFNPDIVVIKLGSNDSKPLNKAFWSELEKDLSNMVDTFRLLPSKPKIYLCLPVPAFGVGNFGITDSVLINVIFPQIKKVAKAKKTELIDLHTALANSSELLPDRIHPNEAGAVLIAKTVAKRLTGKEYEFIPQANLQKHHINFRGNLNNSRLIFENEKVGRVAFLGGSITEMKGWHNIVMEQLKQRFPHTKFEFVEAGIGSTGTTPGAFRMKNDVLEKGKIDLLFVEAAVNDDTNGFDSIAQIRGMEGEVRQALLSNPNMDIVMQHFIYDAFLPELNQGKTPAVIQNHDKVAEYYQIPSINQAQEIAERMQAGEFDWTQFGGTHPAPLGQKYYAAAIESLFDQMWSVSYPDLQLKHHLLPETPLNAFSYYNGKLVDPREAKVKRGWTYESPWSPKEKGTVREKYRNKAILETLTPGAELSFKFKGTAIGIYCLAGPNAGIIEYKVDGGKFKTLDLYTSWSNNLYIPWVYMFETELKDTKHKLTIKMSANKNANSKGNACHIYYFTVNGK